MVELVETQQALAAAVLGLAEHYRSTIVLRFFEELTPTQIARQLDIPASTVRVRLKRGLELLRERLEAEYKDDERHWSLVLLPLAMPPRGATLAPNGSALSGSGLLGVSSGALTKAGLLAVTAGLLSLIVFVTGDGNSPEQTPALTTDSSPRESSVIADPGSELTGGRAPSGALLASQELDDPLSVDPCCIVGLVLDELGQPVAGAEVAAVNAQPRAPQILEVLPLERDAPTTVTSEQGIYRIEVPQNSPYLIRVQHADSAPAESLKAFAGERCDLQLFSGSSITFRVVADKDNFPLEGVDVLVQSVDEHGMPTAWSVAAVTDEIGEAQLVHLPPGEFRAFANLDDYAPKEFVGLLQADESLEQEIRMAAAVTLTGVVLDAATDSPVVGAEVTGADHEVRTDHLGRFELTGFDQSSAELQGVIAVAEGFAPRAEYIRFDTAGPRPHLAVRLQPPLRVVGRVVDSAGVPQIGIDVAYRGRFSSSPMKAERHMGRKLSDEQGRFELSLHPRAGYSVGAQTPGGPMTSTWIGPDKKMSDFMDVGDLVLAAEVKVRGMVRDRIFNREHPDLIEVRKVVGRGDYPGFRQILDVVSVTPTGSFALERLAAGNYEFTLKGYETPLAGKSIVLARRTLSVRSGDVIEDLILRPTPRIRGVVRLPDGRAPERALVGLKVQGSGKPSVATRVNRDGSFEIVPDGPGPFLLKAMDPALNFSPMALENVMPGTEGIELQLQPRATGHTIRGRVVDVHGDPVEGVKIQFTDAVSRGIVARVAIPDARGWFSLDNLNDVPYDLRLMDFEGRFEPAELKGIEPGQTEVEFRLRSHGD